MKTKQNKQDDAIIIILKAILESLEEERKERERIESLVSLARELNPDW